MSNQTAKVLNKVSDLENVKSECVSKEYLLAEVEILNQKLKEEAFKEDQCTKPIVIGSLDFEAFYPSFEPDEVGEIIKKRLAKGPVKIK